MTEVVYIIELMQGSVTVKVKIVYADCDPIYDDPVTVIEYYPVLLTKIEYTDN
jgi:hypothetical protein